VDGRRHAAGLDGNRLVLSDSRTRKPGAIAHADDAGVRVAHFGALAQQDGVRFRVLATAARRLELHLLTGAATGTYLLTAESDEIQSYFVPGARAGDRYAYSIDESDLRPDPASRFQPEGVHQPSEIVDPRAFQWRDGRDGRDGPWHGRPARELTIYELHVGTFTPEGTFAAACARLRDLHDLGVTAVELLPIAEFPGTRNWGYDGVHLYAPSHNYGRPDDLRTFVDAAHALGISVILDVVYNHLGPEGNYLPQFYPDYMTDRHHTPWGSAVNMDGPGSDGVRRFVVDNAMAWITEYRLDGLRLDATHALIDDSATHIVAGIAAAARAAAAWPVAVYAEDHRNLAALIAPLDEGGWALDGVWADDLHHVLRRRLAGDHRAYYQDYSGSIDELTCTLHQGWLFSGQHSSHANGPRGSDPSRIPMQRFVVCLQNHDQVGNRATGDRLHHTIAPAAWRAASTLLLTLPMTPLLFMGQEWAASSPFQYFTDLEPALGVLVTEGRRREFKEFPEFASADARERIPDPQSPATFERSRLDWTERDRPGHAESLALYTDLLHLRNSHRALAASDATCLDVTAPDDATVLMRREADGQTFLVVVRLEGAGTITVAHDGLDAPAATFTTEDSRYVPDPAPIEIRSSLREVALTFRRPGAVILSVPRA
jgi:maltooligosyltrehalose trehalohydrolase